MSDKASRELLYASKQAEQQPLHFLMSVHHKSWQLGANSNFRVRLRKKVRETFSGRPRSLGATTPKPLAPALAQSAASSLILDTSTVTDGWALSKTHELRCFQSSHGIRRAMEARPARVGLGVAILAWIHQSARVVPLSGSQHALRSQARITYQTWREKGHVREQVVHSLLEFDLTMQYWISKCLAIIMLQYVSIIISFQNDFLFIPMSPSMPRYMLTKLIGPFSQLHFPYFITNIGNTNML